MAWLMWLSGLSASLWTKGSLVGFPLRAHAWVAGQIPSRRCARGNHTMMFLSLSSSLPRSLKINKIFKKKLSKSFNKKRKPLYLFTCLFVLMFYALAGVAQWIERWPVKCKAASLIPSEGTRLGCRPGPQLGVGERPPIDVSPPLPAFFSF